MASDTLNPNPVVREVVRTKRTSEFDDDETVSDAFDTEEIFDLIRDIKDPEHGNLTLEQLNVTQQEYINFDTTNDSIDITFTPTIPHCSMVTLIGLCIRVKLIRSLPQRFKVTVKVTPGTHMSEDQVNKQLNDKERVAAALENPNLLEVVNKCLVKTQHQATAA
eukprot:c20814_g1_i1.p1 GENE.c20814_g1_i1~~c20814_g1_i1.p1  ORF type:complete len:178 (+),score=54.04 c20814_g1_i1:43-534(+)